MFLEKDRMAWRGNVVRKTDWRRSPRSPRSGALRILWEDGMGHERISEAKVVDVSDSGMRVRLDEKIPMRSYVTCNDLRLGICGRGSVRYCAFSKGRYEIGIEFSGGMPSPYDG